MTQRDPLAFLDEFVDICPDPVIGVDPRGIINRFNTAAERLLGYRRDEVIGRLHIESLYAPASEARRIGKLLKSGNGQIEGLETALMSREGRRIAIRLSATLLHAGDEIIGSIGFFHDLTERKALEEALKHASITDMLTGLHNQRHFYPRLEEEIIRARRYRRPLSLICSDLDHFKSVNDRLGHQAGDLILREIGVMVARTVRGSDAAFRYGGDEFMVLLPESHAGEALHLAERLRAGCKSCWPPAWESLYPDLARVTMSIGIAELSGEEDAEHFVHRADLAMYEAKRAGGDRCRVASGYAARA